MLPKQSFGAPFQDTASNNTASAATCWATAVTGMVHYITDISASSDLDQATVKVIDGGTVIWEYVLGTIATGKNTIDHTFAQPIWGTAGNAVTVVVTGSGLNKTKANMTGFTAK